MALVETLLVTAALAASPEPVLLFFTSAHCGPCRSVAPVVDRLAHDGYPVRTVDVDQQPQLARQYGVSAVPSFVLVDHAGRVVQRAEGVLSHPQLAQLFQQARGEPSRPVEPAGLVGAASQAGPAGRLLAVPPATASQQQPAGDPPTASAEDVRRRALAATVRLRVEDPRGHSWGTGTIIDVHGQEALIVTCGHLFRDSRGRGAISVELFVPGATAPVAGELITYDADSRDIALVSVRPPVPVRPMPVAPPGHAVQPGEPVFSVGCDGGQDPTVRNSHVTAVNRYLGPANLQVAGQPVDGRSGGGLFTDHGLLIGICNAADPQDDEGLYAALPVIHEQLDLIGQQRIYLASAPGGSRPPAAAAGDTASNPLPAGAPSEPLVPVRHPSRAAAPHDPLGPAHHPAGAPAEIICIVRTADDPQGRVVVVTQPSAELLQQLQWEAAGELTAAAPQATEVIRGQSRR